MPVRRMIRDPLLRLLTSGVKEVLNPGQVVEFEGTEQEIIEWLRDKGTELAEKAVRREIEKVVITQLPERFKTEMYLKDMPADRIRDTFGEALVERVSRKVADHATKLIVEKKLVGAAIETTIDRDLALVSVHVGPEPWRGKEVMLKYEPNVVGPVETQVRFRSKECK